MNTVVKKYGAGIGGLLIVVLTATQAVKVFDLVTILQLVALTLSTIVSMGLVSLLPGKWPGIAKTGVDLLGALIALILPYAIAHGITWQEILLVIIGLIKAVATEFAVQIRTDGLLDARGNAATPGDPAVVTTLPVVADAVPTKAVSGSSQ